MEYRGHHRLKQNAHKEIKKGKKKENNSHIQTSFIQQIAGDGQANIESLHLKQHQYPRPPPLLRLLWPPTRYMFDRRTYYDNEILRLFVLCHPFLLSYTEFGNYTRGTISWNR